ncbi:MAG: rod shape-determining protein [Clostridiales bacterium]|nr:rod shape-determining protein [Clostridiales bacterium]MCD7828274.1 rod shape-determining protein [Clostridiales bacterium]
MPGLYIGIDLGTSNMRAYVEGKGIVSSEPSVVACDAHTGEILTCGREAYSMIGRTPGSMKIVRPFVDSVVSDYNITVKMIKDFADKACRFTVLKPNIIVGVPSNITSVEKKAILDILSLSGAGKVCIMEHPYAAAVGADISFSKPNGTMIIDIGGGTVDIAVVTMGSIAASKTIKGASEAFTNDILRYLRRERDIEAGYLTADYIKRTIGGAVIRSEEIALVAKGRNIVTGSPINFEITTTEVYWAIKERVESILTGVKEILSSVSPELSGDIFENGIILTGSGSLLYGMDTFLESSSGVPVRRAKDPSFCVARGLGKSIHNLSRLRKNGYKFLYREEI